MAPHDTRRINRPSETQSLQLYTPRVEETKLVTNTGIREDGRAKDEIRPIYLKAGVVQKANGSAYLETSGTKLICSVYGPRDIQRKHDFSSKGHLGCELSYAPFSRTDRVGSGHQDALSKEYSSLIVEALQCAVCLYSYPKAQIDVYINVLEDNGNTLSHAIVAASIALADAGIEMLDLVTSCSLVFNDELVCVDPSKRESLHSDIKGSLTIAYLPSLNQISCLLEDGDQDVDQSVRVINTCIEACLRLHEVMNECLTRTTSDKIG